MLIFFRPTNLFYQLAFSFAVTGIISTCSQLHQICHITFVMRDITIHDFIRSPIVPSLRLVIFYGHCSYAFRDDIPFCIFRTFLQQTHHDGTVLPRDSRFLAESGLANTIRFSRHLHFIVVTDCLWTGCKRQSGIQRLFPIFSSSNRFLHISKEHRTRSQYRNIDQAKHLHTFHMSFQTGTISISPFLRIYTGIRFHNTHHLRHYVGIAPWRASLIHISHIPINFLCRSKLIQQLCLSSNNS